MANDQTTIKALKEADDFHKNVALLFEDVVAAVEQRSLATAMVKLQQEGNYSVWGSNNSEHKRLFIFELANVYRFVHILLKIQDHVLRQFNANRYKKMCARIDVDPIFPLLITWGRFQFRTGLERFQSDINLRRNWADNTVLLKIPDEIEFAGPDIYEINKPMTIRSNENTDPWYCEGATVTIRPLCEIQDTRDIHAIVEDLLSL
jgi:hypothetical protein